MKYIAIWGIGYLYQISGFYFTITSKYTWYTYSAKLGLNKLFTFKLQKTKPPEHATCGTSGTVRKDVSRMLEKLLGIEMDFAINDAVPRLD